MPSLGLGAARPGRVQVQTTTIYDAAAHRDQPTLLALYDTNVEWETSRDRTPGEIAGSGVYGGHDGVRTWFRSAGIAHGLVLEQLLNHAKVDTRLIDAAFASLQVVQA